MAVRILVPDLLLPELEPPQAASASAEITPSASSAAAALPRALGNLEEKMPELMPDLLTNGHQRTVMIPFGQLSRGQASQDHARRSCPATHTRRRQQRQG